TAVAASYETRTVTARNTVARILGSMAVVCLPRCLLVGSTLGHISLHHCTGRFVGVEKAETFSRAVVAGARTTHQRLRCYLFRLSAARARHNRFYRTGSYRQLDTFWKTVPSGTIWTVLSLAADHTDTAILRWLSDESCRSGSYSSDSTFGWFCRHLRRHLSQLVRPTDLDRCSM